jgi:hypothetical protein
MILRPPVASVLGIVRTNLRTSVAPALSDQRVLAELGMIDSILGTMIERCTSEQRWISEEVAAIDALADAVLQESQDQRVGEALAALHACEDAAARYDAACELLSRCLEVGMQAGNELRQRAESVLWQRMEHQSQIHGRLEVHGR